MFRQYSLWRSGVALAALLLAAMMPALAQVTVTIGTGTAVSPANSWITTSTTTNRYSRSAHLYTPAEMQSAGAIIGMIQEVAFYKTGSNYPNADATLNMWFKQVPNTTFSGAQAWADLLNGATPVYATNTQSFPATGSGWQTLTLSTPFLLDPTQSLVIITDWFRPSSLSSDMSWQYTTKTGQAAQTLGTVPQTGSLTVGSNRVNLRMSIAPGSNVLDLGVVSNINPNTVVYAAAYTPQVRFRNSGTIAIDSFRVSVLNNSVQQYNTGIPTAIASFNTADVTLPNITLTPGDNQVRVIVTKRNNDPSDVIPRNDTLTYTVRFCASGLQGNYTINASQPQSATNYHTISALTDIARNCGIGGNVVIDVVASSDTLYDQVSFDRVANQVAGSTVIINGNGRVIRPRLPLTNLSGAAFHVAGVNDLTINNLTIVQLGGPIYGLRVGKGSNRFKLQNSTVRATLNTTHTAQFAVFIADSTLTTLANGAPGQDIVLENNTIIGGYVGVRGLTGGDGSLNGQKGLVLRNNRIQSFYQTGIFVTGLVDGIIEGNDVNRLVRRTSVTAAVGISLTGTSAGWIVRNNLVHDLHAAITGTPTVGFTGINIAATGSAARVNQFYNNHIYRNYAAGTATSTGLAIAAAKFAKVYHNTINMLNDTLASGSTTSNTIFWYGVNVTGKVDGTEFRNNLVAIRRQGGHPVFAMALADTVQTNVNFSNNLYYLDKTGNTNGLSALIRLFASATTAPTYRYFNNIADLQTATNGRYEANSADVNPFIFNPRQSSLPTSPQADNRGVFVGVTTDLLGATRSTTTPDVGALEFVGNGCDVPFGGRLVVTNADTALISYSVVVRSANGFVIEYGPTGFTPGTGITVTSNDTTAVLRNLLGFTNYTVYVLQNCNGTLSPYGVPFTFRTNLANDNVCQAVNLPINANGVCNAYTGTTESATFTTPRGYSATGCGDPGNVAPLDVWFRFTTNATGAGSTDVVITTFGQHASQIRLFRPTGSCSANLNFIACQTSGTDQPAGSKTFTGLTPNTLYYVALTSHQPLPAGAGYPYQICITDGPVTGVAANLASKLSVFPNPATSEVHVQMPDNLTGNATVTLYNTAGQAIRVDNFAGVAAGDNLTVPVSQLSGGLYHLVLEANGLRFTGRVAIR